MHINISFNLKVSVQDSEEKQLKLCVVRETGMKSP